MIYSRIIVICFALICSFSKTASAQVDHYGKEFMFLPTPAWITDELAVSKGFKKHGFLAIQAPRPTKGMVTLRNSAGEVSTIPFTVASASTPLFLAFRDSTVSVWGASTYFDGDSLFYYAKKNRSVLPNHIHILADDDISVTYYDDRTGAEASIIYPVTAMGTKYTISGIFSRFDFTKKTMHPSSISITALYDSTVISVRSPVRLIQHKGKDTTIVLDRGQSYIFQALPVKNNDTADLTGMRLLSTKPISVMAGVYGAVYPYDPDQYFTKSATHVFEQQLPEQSYGYSYIIPMHQPPQTDNTGRPNMVQIVCMDSLAQVRVNDGIYRMRRGQVLRFPQYIPFAITSTGRISCHTLHHSIPEGLYVGNVFFAQHAPIETWYSDYSFIVPASMHPILFEVWYSESYMSLIVPTSGIADVKVLGKTYKANEFIPVEMSKPSGLGISFSILTIPVKPGMVKVESKMPVGILYYGYAVQGSYGTVPGRYIADPMAPLQAFNDTIICQGSSAQLSASGAMGNYTWSPTQGLSCTECASPIAMPTKSTKYYVQSTNRVGMPLLDSVMITVRTATVKASEDLGICAGDSIQLTVNEGLSYSWTPSNTLSCSDCRSPFARPTTQQTYYVTMTDKYGCVGIDSVTVSVGKPIADAGKDTIICAGSSVQIFASGGNYYRWEQSPDLSCSDCANPIISPKQSQYYRMRSFISANCYADDSVFITVEKATANIIASKLRYCKNDSIQLRVEGGKSVQWRGAGINCTDCREQKFIAPQSGYYYAEITTDNNCTAQDSVYITINTPQMTVSADTTICRGTSAKMWARGNGRFVWSPPQGLSCTDCDSPLASPTESTEYTVLLYDADNCIASEKVWVYVDSCVIQTQDTITLMASLDCETISAEKTYIHLSDNPLTVQSPIFIRGNTNAFFVEYSVPPGTQLSRNDICKISITMIEKNQGTYSAEYSIGEGKSTKLNVFIQGKYEEKRANIRPHDTTDIIAGSRIPVRLFMENKESGLQEIVMTISYPSRFMKYTDKSLQSLINGEFIVEKTEEKEGFEYVTIRGKGIDIYPSEQEIARFEADTYLGDSSSFTVLTSTQTTNECYRIAPSKATISMGGCFIEGRTVTTGQPYTMTSRVEDNQLILDYTAGLDGKTEFRLINSMGEIVGEPIQRVDIGGEHQLIYSLSNLANGIYIVNFRSGFYTKNECIMYVR
jgi:hypothetical protein